MKPNQKILIPVLVAALVAIGLLIAKAIDPAASKAGALYKEALVDKTAGNFSEGQARLEEALALIGDQGDLSEKIRDELYMYLPLAKIDKQFFQMTLKDGEKLVAGVEQYMTENTERLRADKNIHDVVTLMQRLKTALEHRDEVRLAQLKSLVVQFSNMKTIRKIGLGTFEEWSKEFMPEDMKLIEYKGDYVNNKIYVLEAEFFDVRHQLKIVLDSQRKEVITPAEAPAEAVAETEPAGAAGSTP